MDTDRGIVAIDWGTTNRRIYAIGSGGALEQRFADDRGVSSIPPGGFPEEMAALRARFGERLMLLGGMIGSNRGWIEVPYVPCPATLDRLAQGIWRDDVLGAAIVPGVMQDGERCDVMRGEEVQLLGAVAAGLVPANGRACLPGTHAKWVVLEDEAIVRFKTVMTGELFDLVRCHSILASSTAGEAGLGDAFDRGVDRSLERPELSADLFGVRAQMLLGRLPQADVPSTVSGLLIGADVAIGLGFVGDGMIALIGDGKLSRLYARALDRAGRTYHIVDHEAAFLAGMAALARRI